MTSKSASTSPEPSPKHALSAASTVDQSPEAEISKTFTADLAPLVQEGKAAGVDGLAAMERIAARVVGQENGGALVVRDILRSLFGKTKVDLSQIGRLDWEMRKDICAVILGLNQGSFDDFKIRDILIAAGDHNAAWFFSGLPMEPLV